MSAQHRSSYKKKKYVSTKKRVQCAFLPQFLSILLYRFRRVYLVSMKLICKTDISMKGTKGVPFLRFAHNIIYKKYLNSFDYPVIDVPVDRIQVVCNWFNDVHCGSQAFFSYWDSFSQQQWHVET